MTENLKWKIKTFFSLIWHPVISAKLFRRGVFNFCICPRLKINATKYLTIGDKFYLGRDSRILFTGSYHGMSYNPLLKIGKNVDILQRFTALCASPITIGDNVIIASDVFISSENHGINPESELSYAKQPLVAKPVVIGGGTWLGEKVSIMPGVTLGEKVVVAANSVVTKSFPSYTMIGGVPAKVIKKYNFNTHKWERVSSN